MSGMQMDRDTLMRGAYANRTLVRIGFAGGIAMVLIWALFEPWTEAISVMRLPVYLSVALCCGLIVLLLSGPPHRALYPALAAASVWIHLALLLVIADSLFGEPAAALHAGVVPLELTVLPIAMMVPYVYLLPPTASQINLVAMGGYLLLGLFYALLEYQRPWEELCHAIWTINSCICIGALSSIFAKVHIRHSRLIASTLEERLAQCDTEIAALEHQLEWDPEFGCLNGRGLRRRLQQELSTPGEDLLVGIVQRRAHPPPGPSARTPRNWAADLRAMVEMLRQRFPEHGIGYHSKTTLIVWHRGQDLDAFIAAVERLRQGDAVQPALFATARNYMVLDGEKSLLLEAILDDLASDMFLRAHGLR